MKDYDNGEISPTKINWRQGVQQELHVNSPVTIYNYLKSSQSGSINVNNGGISLSTNTNITGSLNVSSNTSITGSLNISSNFSPAGNIVLSGTSKIIFSGDSENTYIAANTDSPEDLEIHADQDIILRPDRNIQIARGSLNNGTYAGLHIIGSNAQSQILLNRYEAADTAITNNASLGVIYFGRTPGDATNNNDQFTANIAVKADQNWSSTAHGTRIEFQTTTKDTVTQTTPLILDSNANAGIGTTPGARLHVYNDLAAPDDLGDFDNYQVVIEGGQATNKTAGVMLTTSTSGNGGSSIVHVDKGNNGLGDLTFYTKQSTSAEPPVQIMRLTSDNNVQICSAHKNGTNPGLHVIRTGNQPYIFLSRQADSNDDINVGNSLGTIYFGGTPGNGTDSNSQLAGYIEASADENWSDSAHGTRLHFGTINNTGTSRSIKMTLKNDGNLGIGTTTPKHKLDVPGVGGLIYGTNYIHRKDSNGDMTLGTSLAILSSFADSGDSAHSTDISFVAPSNGLIKIRISFHLKHVDDTTAHAEAFFGIYSNNNNGLTGYVTDIDGVSFDDMRVAIFDDFDNEDVVLEGYFKGLTAGTTYLWEIHGKSSHSNAHKVTTDKNHKAFIVEAISLPDSAVNNLNSTPADNWNASGA